MLPPRPDDAYKNRFGHLLVVAGSPGRSGAALLASQAGLRGGAGLVTLATGGEVRTKLEGQVPDLMVEAIRGGAAEAARVVKLLVGKAAIVVGPGMGTTSADIDLLGRLCDGFEGPLVLDADALTIVSEKPAVAAGALNRLVLTPHPGEAARLLGVEVASVLADPLAAARQLAERFGAVVALKGARTLVVDAERLAIVPRPEPALAVAGTGDVLAGLIGALLAQGCTPWVATCLGVAVHNRAGAAVAASVGLRASTASDVLAAIGGVWLALEALPAAKESAAAGSD